MAFLYMRKGSPFWWLKYRAPDGKLVQESTGLLASDHGETRRARELAARKNLEQITTTGGAPGERWEAWGLSFLENRYKDSQKTLERYSLGWRNLLVFLKSRQLVLPRQLRYAHVMEYLAWRKKPDQPGVFRARHNTALNEISVLRMLCREAVRRGFATDNPCLSLGVKKDKAAEKPEITDAELAEIRKALKKEPAWMQTAFEIAIHQGCRLRETAVPLRDVDLERGTITFNAKGSNRFTTALHPTLAPMFRKMKDDGLAVALDMPPLPSKAWWLFFKRLKMRHLCFHCTRVSVITRLARSGVPSSQAMRFVGHASETIHRVYQRLGTDDLGACLTALRSVDKPKSP